MGYGAAPDSEAPTGLTHSCLRPPSVTMRSSSANTVRFTSPTNCDSCECVRLQNTTCTSESDGSDALLPLASCCQNRAFMMILCLKIPVL
jgi:hypothetical protein